MAAAETSATAGAPGRWSLRGKTALVTGGTRGIGGGGACGAGGGRSHLLPEGGGAGQAPQGVGGKGFRVTVSVCDLSVREQRERLLRDVGDRFGGKLDILVNNVGTDIRKPTTEYSAEDYSFVMSTSLEYAYHLCQLAHPLLKASGSASIVLVTSIAGIVALYSGTDYAMTKGAMNQLTKNLAREWAEDNIKTNFVAPGYIFTSLIEGPLAANKMLEGAVKSQTPLRRIGEPEEVWLELHYRSDDLR